MKNQKGITLVALVITIIVLLILAGVSISLVLGQNGVLTQASNAVVKNDNAAVEQDVKLAAADATTAYYAAWAENSQVHKGAFYTENVFSNNCTGGTISNFTSAGDDADSGNVTFKYKSKSTQTVYECTVNIATGATTVAVGSSAPESTGP